GRELGFPTANLHLDPGCGLKHGIYAVRVGVGERSYDGVASFGRRPTFDQGTVLLEPFLFDFSDDLYGEEIDVAFIDWIRQELKFDRVEDLVRRMNEDAKLTRVALAAMPDAFPRLGPACRRHPPRPARGRTTPCSRRPRAQRARRVRRAGASRSPVQSASRPPAAWGRTNCFGGWRARSARAPCCADGS
ncbi:MAG: hypothetical protein E6G80_01020, partial [Alphaproteobacteria bacterium]